MSRRSALLIAVIAAGCSGGPSSTPTAPTPTPTTTRVISLSGFSGFGNVTIGTTANATITITNSGSGTLTWTGLSTGTVAMTASPTGGTVAAGSSATVTLTFAPTAVQAYAGTLTVASDATGGTNTLALTGTGIAAPPTPSTPTRIIALSGNLAFGNVAVGVTATTTVTIANTGNDTLTVSAVSYPPSTTGNFANGTIAAAGSRQVNVSFTPTAAQTYTGTLTVASDATSGSNTVAVSGVGTTTPTPTRIIALSGNLGFGTVAVGSTATANLTISNSGNSTLTWSGLSTGTTAVTASPTNGAVTAGGSATVALTFAPTAAQAYSGTVTVTSNATTGTNTLGLSGTGTAAPPPVVTGLDCGVERWSVKTLADADATRVNLSGVQVTTIKALNALPVHCSAIPDARTYAPEFQVYETTGRIIVARSEDDRDYHVALSDPDDASATIVTELADVACSGAATSIYRDTLNAARTQFDTFRAGRSLASLTGSLVTVRGVGFYDFNHGQTGRSQSCLELHPVIMVAAAHAPIPLVLELLAANSSRMSDGWLALLDQSRPASTNREIENTLTTVGTSNQQPFVPIDLAATDVLPPSGSGATDLRTVDDHASPPRKPTLLHRFFSAVKLAAAWFVPLVIIRALWARGS